MQNLLAAYGSADEDDGVLPQDNQQQDGCSGSQGNMNWKLARICFFPMKIGADSCCSVAPSVLPALTTAAPRGSRKRERSFTSTTVRVGRQKTKHACDCIAFCDDEPSSGTLSFCTHHRALVIKRSCGNTAVESSAITRVRAVPHVDGNWAVHVYIPGEGHGCWYSALFA